MARSAVLEGEHAAIDPRIRERRATVQRDRGRRWLRRLCWAGGVVAVPALLLAVTRSQALDVDRLEVGGAASTGVLEVVAASGIDLGAPMTDLDLGAAARAVERLPWVDDAVLDRDWPGTVRIVVTEREPVAAVAAGDRWALVDRSSRVLAVADGRGSLPMLDGVGAVPAAGQDLRAEAAAVVAVAAGLPPSLASGIEEIELREDGVHLVRHAGGDVLLGDARSLEAKVEALATMDARVDLTCLDTLDLRVPSAPVLTRSPGCG